ncbi:hypothetical protein ELH97_08685 [Rhizobium leguminosarum]|uniref:hypothetical protein n=1 Tax=Rhizobium leguminosarum TaxID=384 RepID=UPI001031CFAF|nr:hypothetical protein [Rhizobium leguminosarum]TAX91995.1 hypothetical protein ELH97_08685 [Rhizobium leguminosarum]
MTEILNVTRDCDGQFQITDQRGNVVEGPFDTNAAAWSALDRIDHERMPGRPGSNKKVLWGKPEKPAKRNGKKAGRRLAGCDQWPLPSSIQPASASSGIISSALSALPLK